MSTKTRTVLEEKALKALWALLRRIRDNEEVAYHMLGTETLSLAYEAILESEGFDADLLGSVFLMSPVEFKAELEKLEAARKLGGEAHAANLEQDCFPIRYSQAERRAWLHGWSLAEVDENLRDWENEGVDA